MRQAVSKQQPLNVRVTTLKPSEVPHFDPTVLKATLERAIEAQNAFWDSLRDLETTLGYEVDELDQVLAPFDVSVSGNVSLTAVKAFMTEADKQRKREEREPRSHKRSPTRLQSLKECRGATRTHIKALKNILKYDGRCTVSSRRDILEDVVNGLAITESKLDVYLKEGI